MLTPPLKPFKPFGMDRVPIDPRTGRHLPLSDVSAVRRFLVTSEEGDYLKCLDLRGNVTYVAKPLMLRRTLFDGLEVDDVTYTYTSNTERKADTWAEWVFPEYVIGREYILAVRFPGGVFSPFLSESAESELDLSLVKNPDGMRIEWQDINTAGRTWVRQSGMFLCYAEKTGGTTAGDASNTCDHTYTLYDTDQTTVLVKNVDGDEATGMEPEASRLVETKYTTPSGKNPAWAFRDSSGELHLWDANEVPYPPEAC